MRDLGGSLGGIGQQPPRADFTDMNSQYKKPLTLAALALGGFCVFGALTVGLAALRPGLFKPVVQFLLAPTGGSLAIGRMETRFAPYRIHLQDLHFTLSGGLGGEVSLKSLWVQPDLIQGFSKGVWFKLISAAGVGARFEPRAQAGDGPVSLETLGWLSALGRASLEEARVSLVLPGVAMYAGHVNLSLEPQPHGHQLNLEVLVSAQGPEGESWGRAMISGKGTVAPGGGLAMELTVSEVQIGHPLFRASGHAYSRLKLTPRGLEVSRLELSLDPVRLTFPGGTASLHTGLELALRADTDLAGNKLRLKLSHLALKGLAWAQGELALSEGRLQGKIQGRVTGLKPLARLLPPALTELETKGELPFTLARASSWGGWRFSLDLQDFALSLPVWGFWARSGGKLELTGTGKGDAGLSGDVSIKGRLRTEVLTLQEFTMRLPLRGSIFSPRSPGWEFAVAQGKILAKGVRVPLGGIRAGGDLEWNRGSLNLKRLFAFLEGVGRLEGEAGAQDGMIQGGLKGKELKMEPVLPLIAWAGGLDLSRWSSEGAWDLSVRWQGPWPHLRLKAQASARGLGLSSPQGDYLGQGLGLGLDLDLDLAHKPRSHLLVRAKAAQGEILADMIYLNLAAHPLSLVAAGEPAGEKGGTAMSLAASLGKLGRADIKINVKPPLYSPVYSGTLAISGMRLGPLFTTFVKEPFSGSRLGLADLDLKGSAEVRAAFSGSPRALYLQGRASIKGGKLLQKEGTRLEGLHLDLPLAYTWGKAQPLAAARKLRSQVWGRLKIRRLLVPKLLDQGFDLAIALRPNQLLLPGPVKLSLWGGAITANELKVANPLSREFSAQLQVRMDNLDLAQMPSPMLLDGALSGDLSPVRLNIDELIASGVLQGDLFGGRLKVSGLKARRPFSPGRVLQADITFDRIDMEPLSLSLGAGRITGLISGGVKDLAMAYGQPVALDMKVMSPDEPGMERKVSLEALNSISILGTGSGITDLGASLMSSIFNDFPYAKMGLACKLDNDVFRIQGLIHDNGTEYLVKRPLFGGITVVNKNPNNRISFSDMLERLQRVMGDEAGPEVSTGNGTN